jgi:EAL domain-containing protein (putative c-di-GMP-specific phosphodiesterase class I)
VAEAVRADRAARVPRTASELDAALDAGLLTVEYQPVVDLRTGAVVATEALARLRDPVGGALIPPDAFIPMAEATNRIRRIDMQVLEIALPHAAAWRALRPGQPFSIGVNLSVPDLEPDLPGFVAGLLRQHGVPANALIIELTETVLSSAGCGHGAVLRGLADLGCDVTMDDFGTGYSSLSHLRRFPVDGIKIDREFVWDLDGAAHGARVAASLVRFGLDLGVHVVAEGIETVSQLHALRELGCPFGQGYLFARPLSAADVTAFLTRTPVVPLPRTELLQ